VFTYDGSNRLKDVYVPDMTTSPYDPTAGTRVAHFDYDGLGRQVRSVYNTDADGSLDDEDVEWTPRDFLGRPIGIWRQGPVSGGARPCAKPYQLFGYNSTGFRGTGYDASSGILDCPVVRWRDTDNDGTLDETLYYLQDLRGDITALLDPVSQDIVERVRYGPTGRPEAFPAADVNFDGKVDGGDKDAFEAALDAFTSDPANYDPRADLDRDGDVDAKDEELFFAGYGKFGGLSGNWKLSQGDGLTPGSTGADAGLDNRFGWRGYWYDSHLQKYHVRNRVYDPREGQWLQTDPIGFDAGDQNLYRYCGGEYSMGYDPTGLSPRDEFTTMQQGVNAARDEYQRRELTGPLYQPIPNAGLVLLSLGFSMTAVVGGIAVYEVTAAGLLAAGVGPTAVPFIAGAPAGATMSAIQQTGEVAIGLRDKVSLGEIGINALIGSATAGFGEMILRLPVSEGVPTPKPPAMIAAPEVTVAPKPGELPVTPVKATTPETPSLAKPSSTEGGTCGGADATETTQNGGLPRKWKVSEFEGQRTYQRDDLIDPLKLDAKGRTNLQRMQQGLAPVGSDGKSIVLHHTIQTMDGPVVELNATFHQDNSAVLHINQNTTPSGIDRPVFKPWRERYWINRAKDF
jgi:RHS repeat-associated protein